MITQMKATESVTEELKARDPMAWVGAMNNIRSRVEEIILRKMIYAYGKRKVAKVLHTLALE